MFYLKALGCKIPVGAATHKGGGFSHLCLFVCLFVFLSVCVCFCLCVLFVETWQGDLCGRAMYIFCLVVGKCE